MGRGYKISNTTPLWCISSSKAIPPPLNSCANQRPCVHMSEHTGDILIRCTTAILPTEPSPLVLDNLFELTFYFNYFYTSHVLCNYSFYIWLLTSFVLVLNFMLVSILMTWVANLCSLHLLHGHIFILLCYCPCWYHFGIFLLSWKMSKRPSWISICLWTDLVPPRRL